MASVPVRVQYVVVARHKRCQFHTYRHSTVLPWTFAEVGGADAPLAARVKCRARGDERILRQVDYRLVDAVLMRCVVNAVDGAPLTLERMAAMERDEEERYQSYRDHPSHPGRIPQFGPEEVPLAYHEVEKSTRDEAVALAASRLSAMRVVDGVLYRPAPPPCWTVDHDGERLTIRPHVAGDDAVYRNSVSFGDPRLNPDLLPSRLRKEIPYAVGRLDGSEIEVLDPSAMAGGHRWSLVDFLARETSNHVNYPGGVARFARSMYQCVADAANGLEPLDAAVTRFDDYCAVAASEMPPKKPSDMVGEAFIRAAVLTRNVLHDAELSLPSIEPAADEPDAGLAML